MMWPLILILCGIAVCLGIYAEMVAQHESKTPKPKIRPLTPDEESARKHYREQEAFKVEVLAEDRPRAALAWEAKLAETNRMEVVA